MLLIAAIRNANGSWHDNKDAWRLFVGYAIASATVSTCVSAGNLSIICVKDRRDSKSFM
jgi:hypothetical protein